MRNVLADECLFLLTVGVAIDLLRTAHGRIMTLKSGRDWKRHRSQAMLLISIGWLQEGLSSQETPLLLRGLPCQFSTRMLSSLLGVCAIRVGARHV